MVRQITAVAKGILKWGVNAAAMMNFLIPAKAAVMIDNANDPYKEWEIELAKRIACAVVSYKAGVSFEDLWHQYADQREDVGTFWLSVAKQIDTAFPCRPQ